MSIGNNNIFSTRCGFIATILLNRSLDYKSYLVCKTKLLIENMIYDVLAAVSVALLSSVAWVSL
jgi:hypothetical protein